MLDPRPLTVRAFIGSLDRDASEAELRAGLADIGVEVSHVDMALDRAAGARRGFAYVVVAGSPTRSRGASGAPAFLDLMRTATVRGRPITVHAIPESLRGRHSASRPV